MYIGRPGLGVLKLITVLTAPVWGVVVALTASRFDIIKNLTAGRTSGAAGLVVLVALSGVIWWFADLFLIRDAACAMRLNPYCIDPEDIDLDDETEGEDEPSA